VYVQWGLTTLAALLTLAFSAVSSHVAWRGAASKQPKDGNAQPLLKPAHPAPCQWRLMVRAVVRISVLLRALLTSFTRSAPERNAKCMGALFQSRCTAVAVEGVRCATSTCL